MNTCPDCGSMIMEGDPYCSHCGVHLQWDGLEDDSASQLYRKDDLEDILDSMFINSAQRQILKAKLESFLKAKDCTRMEARTALDEYVFAFTRENGYVRQWMSSISAQKTRTSIGYSVTATPATIMTGFLKAPSSRSLSEKLALNSSSAGTDTKRSTRHGHPNTGWLMRLT